MDVQNLPFFRKIQEWQRDYGFHGPARETGNWLCPCAIRDHSGTFLKAAVASDARPINDEARQAIEDPAYAQAMLKYGQEMAELTDRDWQEQYVGPRNDLTGAAGHLDDDLSSVIQDSEPTSAPLR